MSRVSCSNDPGSPAASSAVSASGSSRRPQPTTVAPSRAISSAVSRPRPLPAPETTTTAPSSRPSLNTCERDAFSHRRPAYSRDPQAYCGTDMAVHVEPQPLDAPLPGGQAGATVAVEPLIAGHVDFPRAAMVDQGGSFKTLRLARAITSSKQAAIGPRPRLPDPPPDRRPDPRRHRPPPLDRERRLGELRRPRQPLRPARRWRRAKTSPRSCAPRGSSRARSRSW